MPPSPVSARRTRIRLAASAVAAAALVAGTALILVSAPDPAPRTSPRDAFGPRRPLPDVLNADLLAYGGPEEATRADPGPGPYTLPEDPCTVLTEETLAGLGHTADFAAPAENGCSWAAESMDGGLHGLSLTYTRWENAEEARLRFDEEFDRLRGDGGDPLWEQESSAGEQSRLVLAVRDRTYSGTLLARQGEVQVTVVRTFVTGSHGAAGAERGVETRLLGELGRQALGALE